MSTGFGVNKGKDGKYNTLNLTQYKGRSTDSSKPSGSSGVRHGLQSLGKVASTRRVPPPASLPSLKSENLGNDPNINLVPKDGSGWASKNDPSSQTSTPQTQQETQPKSATVTYSQQAQYQTPSQPTSVSRNQNSSNPPQTSSASQPMWGSSRHAQLGNKVSAAAGGGQARGTTHFSDDFPTLSDTQKEQQSGQGDDPTREQQYGPGPSLRPQNVASWREGGGRNLPPPPVNEAQVVSEENKKLEQHTQSAHAMMKSSHLQHSFEGSELNQGQSMVRPMGQPPRQPQHYPPNMMPPYMYNRFQHPGMAPPVPGARYAVGLQQRMRYPPYVNMNDPRYRSMMMAAQQQTSQGDSTELSGMNPQSNMKDFDKLDTEDDDGGWATMHGEVDYGEKLVFSDDEEGNSSKSRKSSMQDNPQQEHSEHKDSTHVTSQAWGASQSGGMDVHPMPAWSQPGFYRMYPEHSDARSNKPQPPYEKRLPPQGQMFPGPPIQHQQMYSRHPMPVGQRFQRPMSSEIPVSRASPNGEDEHWRKSEKGEALERARKRKEEEEKRMELARSSYTPENKMRQQFEGMQLDRERQQHFAAESHDDAHKQWSKFENIDVPAAVHRGRRTESESSEDRRLAWQERPPGDGFGGNYRPTPHPSGSQGRNLPPRLAQQRQERLGQRSSQMAVDQSWSSSVQPQGTRPSIMKRERKESEDSEDPQKGSRSRQLSESSQSFGRATPDDERNLYQAQEINRRDARKVVEGQRLYDNRSPSVGDQRLLDSGTSKSSTSRQSSRDTNVSTNDSRRGSLKTLLTRTDSGSRSVTKRGSNQYEKNEEHRQQETVRPRRMDNKVKMRDFRVESDDEDVPMTTSKTDGRNKKSGFQQSSNDPFTEHKIWNNDKTNKPIATVLPSTTTNTMTRSEPKKRDPVTKSITRDVVSVQPTTSIHAESNVTDRENRERNRSHNLGKGSKRDLHDRRTTKFDSYTADVESEDSGGYSGKSSSRTSDYHSERTRETAHRGDKYSDRDRKDTRGPPHQRRGEKSSDNRYRQNEQRYKRESKEQKYDSRRESQDNKGRSTQAARKAESLKIDSDKQLQKEKQLTDNVKATSAETKQKPLPAPPATNIWEERKKQMQKEVKPDKNFTYIPTEEDRKRTLKETAPVISLDDAEGKPPADYPAKSKSSNWEKADHIIEDSDRKAERPFRDNSYRRGSSHMSSRGDRRGVDRYASERYDRRGGRGRGRSRGIRGRGGGVPVTEKISSAPRGRGQRRGARSAPNRGYDYTHSYPSTRSSNKYNDNTDSYDDEEYSSESEDDTRFVGRRRKEASTDESYSDNSESERPSKLVAKPSNTNKNTKQTKASEDTSSTFVARGEPSRRGRGRGAMSSSYRGRGRPSANGVKNLTPPQTASGRGRRADNNQYQDTNRVAKNVERGPFGPGAEDRRKHGSRSNDKRKRKSKPDQPPRFKNSVTAKKSGNSEGTKSVGPVFHRAEGAQQPSSDVDWETASEDNSTDYRKTATKTLAAEALRDIQTRNIHPRSQSRKGGRGGKGETREHHRSESDLLSAIDNQVYVLHTVDYTDPSAIEGAIRDASASQHDKAKKLEDDQKAKNKELFRRYDLHNYAGVVNVDDLPDVSAQRRLQDDLNLSEDMLTAVLDSTPTVDKDDEDGFTPVLSKRAQKKKQENIRKKHKEGQAGENYRKQRMEQQRQTKHKLIAKSLNGLKSGSSGSVKQTISTTTVSTLPGDHWLTPIDTWEPLDTKKKVQADGVEPVISQHDSGVESSVPSSQRSSPGTEAKLSFSQFATTMTSTSVITSICNHDIPIIGQLGQHSADLMHPSPNMDLPSNDLVSPFLDSPTRRAVNPIGPIGNERLKTQKRSDSVENITSLFHQETNVISFIADEPDENPGQQASSGFFTPDDLRSSTFSPFGEPPNTLSDHSQQFQGFQTPEFPDSSVTPEVSHDVPSSSYHLGDFPHSAAANDLSRSRNSTASNESFASHAVKRNNFGNIGPIQQSTTLAKFADTHSPEVSSSSNASLGHKAGAYPDSETLEDMTLTPPNTANTNVTHSTVSLEGPIPAPIPMPPTHTPTNKQGLDTDAKNGIRQARDVNPSASVASELGLLTPTSPSLDFNLKMESARKAWENMPESSSGSSQQQSMNQSESHSFHTSTEVTQMNENSIPHTSVPSMSSVTLSVTKSSEWKPRHLANVSSTSSTDDSSWTQTVQQTAVSQMSTPETQENTISLAATSSITEATMSMHTSAYGGMDTTGSSITTQQQSLQVASQYSNNPYMYMDVQQSQLMQHGQRLVQGSQSALYQQPISTTSLATNLQQMQQIYNNYPPEFAQSLYSAPGYNSLSQQHQSPAYNTQAYLASNAMGSPAAPMKSGQQQPQQSQQPQAATLQQASVRSGGLSANYGAASASAVPGLGQQGNISSTQLAIPRPHSGAPSPAQQLYLPIVEQNRVATQGSSVALVNQPLNIAPRAQSTSFYSQLNQATGTNYYNPQSQLRQTPYQQTAMHVSQPFQQNMYPQSIKPISPTPTPTNQLGLEHTAGLNANMQSSYAPIAPPNQRLRSETDYNLPNYQTKTQQHSATKMPPPPYQGAFGAMKSTMPSSASFGSVKSAQSMYVPSAMIGTQEHMSSAQLQMQKYSMSNTAASSTVVKPAVGQLSGDWNKAPTSQQYRGSSVQGILSRPYSSSGESMYQHSPAAQSSFMAPKPNEMSASNMGLTFPMQNQQQMQSYNAAPSWNQKLVSPQAASMPSPHSGAGILGKAPPRPVMPVMAPQRFTVAQPFQSNMISPQQAQGYRSQMPYQVKQMPSSGMKMQQSTSQFAPIHDSLSMSQGHQPLTQQKQNKTMGSKPMTSSTKTPPVPTLVRGSGSNLVGKKPTYMPEEVVKSNQANERANLLQSLSAFFPEKATKAEDSSSEEKGTDWSTQVANSSPLPKRKPGMRHPGVDKRKLMNRSDRTMEDKMKRSGPIGATKGVVKRPQKNEYEYENENGNDSTKKTEVDTEQIAASTKKLTLADTQPKKGETAKIK
uniref:Protein PRRC2C n=1 Tax=Phallusia mammillata TaxID=59560 RepID=A0A6F9DQ91_9ASCI|nr:protein PRRC2C [Phallusia mammillata]